MENGATEISEYMHSRQRKALHRYSDTADLEDRQGQEAAVWSRGRPGRAK